MKYLIDTNLCIYILNNRPVEVIHKFKQFAVGEIGISTITVSELQYGVEKSMQQKQNQVRLDEFLAPLEILSFNELAARMYGDIRLRLEQSGQSIDPIDLFIAAHALSQNLIIVTNNDNKFKCIKDLDIEDWTQ